ncbi:MAG: Lrp/AsnC family transcriptional regulator [Candidatus Kapabacteria bacterium]|nr:Lrp/AsnC family transcriptional regulator [Candidatus Kapabacteria bacterium]MDW8012567.1 Lrp/AsnC family transcriptional regulator [Bacteroidota bacterium]
MKKFPEVKDIDRLICSLLQRNARLTLRELARQVKLSVPTVREHIRRLEEQGIIEGYFTKLNHRVFGYDITAFISVFVESSVHYPEFLARCKRRPEILECHAITGEASHLLKVRTHDTASLEQLLADIQRWPGVRRTLTSLVLSTHVETLAFPIR